MPLVIKPTDNHPTAIFTDAETGEPAENLAVAAASLLSLLTNPRFVELQNSDPTVKKALETFILALCPAMILGSDENIADSYLDQAEQYYFGKFAANEHGPH